MTLDPQFSPGQVFRDYATDGVPASGPHKPVKSAIRTLLDALVSGAAPFARVRVVATSNVAIATALENGDTIDSVVLATGNAVLLTGQTAPAENGLYVVPASGPASRHGSFNTYNEHPGCFVSVEEGTLKADTLWRCTSNRGGTLGVTAIAFTEFVATFPGASTTEALTGTETAKGVTPDSLAAFWEAGADNTGGATITMGEGGYFNLITSTAAITAFAFTTDKAGRTARVRFNTIRTLTHHATALILPTGANITTAVGDIMGLRSLGGGNFVVEWYTRADGSALAASGTGLEYVGTLTTTSGTTKTQTGIGTNAQEIHLVLRSVSNDSGGGASLRVELSEDNGGSWGAAVTIGQLITAGASVGGKIIISNTGRSAVNKVITNLTGLVGSSSFQSWIAETSTKTGIINAIRLSWTGGVAAFDAGGIDVFKQK